MDPPSSPTRSRAPASPPKEHACILRARRIAASAISRRATLTQIDAQQARKIPRNVDEDSRDVARALATTPEFKVACRRQKKVEMLFAHLKRILRLGRLRLRGPCGAKDEFLLAATAQNLRRLARLRPAMPPMEAVAG